MPEFECDVEQETGAYALAASTSDKEFESVRRDLQSQEQESDILVESGPHFPASLGAERKLEEVAGVVCRQPEGLNCGVVGTFSCADTGCQWYCNHHNHLSQNRDFFCDAEIFQFHAKRECPGCTLWRDIAASRCGCKLADEEPKSQFPDPHPPKWLRAMFDSRHLPVLEMGWSCGSIYLELEASQDIGTPVSKYGGTVHLDRLSPECVSLFQDWIQHCDRHHRSCLNNDLSIRPKRLLRVDRLDNGGDVTLCKMGKAVVKYLALSYCWGGTKPPQTTVKNKADHERGIPQNALPKSYLDTILLARKLCIPYVWIDSYCIVQDDDNERAYEIARMGGIFQNAYLVVIAASASSPYAGYLANNLNAWAVEGRARFKWRQTLVRYGKLGFDTVSFRQVVHREGQGEDACARMRIGKRAWTYQERQLASRCLIFQGREVIWECRRWCLCECGGNVLSLWNKGYLPQLLPFWEHPADHREIRRKSGSNSFLDETEAYVFWRHAVQVYSSRELTYVKDRLPAISALAVIVQQQTGDEYFAGLWKGDLTRQLTWHNNPSYDDTAPYDEYVAPSWSWASTPVPTAYNKYPPNFQPSYRVSLLGANCLRAGPDPLGAVLDGYLKLDGVHCSAQAIISTSGPRNWPYITLTFKTGQIHETEGPHSDFSFLDGLRVHSVEMEIETGASCSTLQRLQVSTSRGQHHCSGRVRLLWLEDDVCLLLAYSRRVPGAFERIGILSSDMSPSMPSYPPSCIKLV